MEPPRIPEPDKDARITRRQFVATSSLVVTAGLGGSDVFGREDELAATGQGASGDNEIAVRVGIVTDLHYADKETAGTRHYRESKSKLEEAVALFKEQKIDFIAELGDIVDAAPTVAEEAGYLETIGEVIRSAACPVHYVLGNHCVATLTKEEFLEETGAGKTYYSFDAGGVHFVVLDACFNSKMEAYGRNNFAWDDSNIPEEELDWLAKDLGATRLPAVVFAHQRLDLEPGSHYAVKQSPAVRATLEKSGKVRAVFQGHSHKNELHEIAGIPYCTIAAMVEGSGEENNSYGILEITRKGAMRVRGFRKLVDRELT